MTSKLKELELKQLIKTPNNLSNLTHMEVIMGSEAYGCALPGSSDTDVYGFAIPPRDSCFPHEAGFLFGFLEKPKELKTYVKHHVLDKSARGGKGVEYDFAIYWLIDYVNLLLGSNPNMLSSLFVPDRCILHMTPVGLILRENRKMLLSKRVWKPMVSYSYQQIHKLRIKNPGDDSKRREIVDKYGYDVKFALNCVRLLDECEMILVEQDLDLERNSEKLKSIRRGEWTLEEVERYYKDNETRLANLYDKSSLPIAPDIKKVKNIVLQMLEQHFGNLAGAITLEDPAIKAIKDIENIVEKYKAGNY